MQPVTQAPATIDDLYKVEGKAELIGGRIIHYVASGHRPTRVAFEIAVSLRAHVQRLGRGTAYPDGIGYALDPPLPSGRQSFSPDTSYFDGPPPANQMRFIDGAPTLAVEVRSENDYTTFAESEMAAKRGDYFVAGTLVVWDVDPVAERITCYRSDDPAHPTVFVRGDTADAEPAVPGWRVPVDSFFDV